MEKLANNIVKLRVMNGLSQDDLANKVGVSRQTIHKWEKGITSPKGNNLNLLCEVLDVSMDQLLGKKPLILDKKIELAIDELKTDLKEQDAKTIEKRRKVLIKRIIKCILTILLTIIIIYACCTTYKFIILTDISNKVSKYENLDNYYCEIEKYNDNNLQQKKNIWYKDQKYKIETIKFNDIGEITLKTTNIINLEDNTKIVYNNDEKNDKIRELNDKEMYINGRYMYSLFPDIIKKSTKIKMENSFGINILKFKCDENDNTYNLRINNMQVKFDRETYVPTFYADGNNNDKVKQYFTIELNNISEEDLN